MTPAAYLAAAAAVEGGESPAAAAASVDGMAMDRAQEELNRVCRAYTERLHVGDWRRVWVAFRRAGEEGR